MALLRVHVSPPLPLFISRNSPVINPPGVSPNIHVCKLLTLKPRGAEPDPEPDSSSLGHRDRSEVLAYFLSPNHIWVNSLIELGGWGQVEPFLIFCLKRIDHISL